MIRKLLCKLGWHCWSHYREMSAEWRERRGEGWRIRNCIFCPAAEVTEL